MSVEQTAPPQVVARLPKVVAKLKRWVEESARYDLLMADGCRVVASDGRKAIELLLQHDDPCDADVGLVHVGPGREVLEAVAAASKLNKLDPMPVEVTEDCVRFRNGAAIPGLTVEEPRVTSLVGTIHDSIEEVASGDWVKINPAFLRDIGDIAAALKLDTLDIAICGDRLVATSAVTADGPVASVRIVCMLIS